LLYVSRKTVRSAAGDLSMETKGSVDALLGFVQEEFADA
jgi:hypothetical protein